MPVRAAKPKFPLWFRVAAPRKPSRSKAENELVKQRVFVAFDICSMPASQTETLERENGLCRTLLDAVLQVLDVPLDQFVALRSSERFELLAQHGLVDAVALSAQRQKTCETVEKRLQSQAMTSY